MSSGPLLVNKISSWVEAGHGVGESKEKLEPLTIRGSVLSRHLILQTFREEGVLLHFHFPNVTHISRLANVIQNHTKKGI